METEKQILHRLKAYLKEEEEAKKRNDKIAKQSFENWSKDNIEKIGRANSYKLNILKSKFGKIWKWLWS